MERQHHPAGGAIVKLVISLDKNLEDLLSHNPLNSNLRHGMKPGSLLRFFRGKIKLIGAVNGSSKGLATCTAETTGST
jgi:hypothetical protein